MDNETTFIRKRRFRNLDPEEKALTAYACAGAVALLGVGALYITATIKAIVSK